MVTLSFIKGSEPEPTWHKAVVVTSWPAGVVLSQWNHAGAACCFLSTSHIEIVRFAPNLIPISSLLRFTQDVDAETVRFFVLQNTP